MTHASQCGTLPPELASNHVGPKPGVVPASAAHLAEPQQWWKQPLPVFQMEECTGSGQSGPSAALELSLAMGGWVELWFLFWGKG